VPISNNGGNPLVNLNDAITIILTNNPLGQDGIGTFTVTPGPGGYQNAQVIFEECLSFANFAANVWQPIPQAYQQSPSYSFLPNSESGLLTQPVGGTVYSYVLFSITGYYAVRMRLAAQPASGSLVVTGNTIPAVTVNNPADLNQLATIASSNNAQVIGLSLLLDTDLLYWATNGQQSL
jgi:hypothetical protein